MSNIVLFLNHREKECGVQQYGFAVGEVLKKSTKYNFLYKEISNNEEYVKLSQNYHPIATIFNWHRHTMRWLDISSIAANQRNIFILHDSHPGINNPVIYLDPTYVENGNNFKIGRLILPFNTPSCKVEDNVIGSFGFGFSDKGFVKIVHQVNQEFDKARVRLHIAHSIFGDPAGSQANERIKECKLAAKPGIDIEHHHVFLDVENLLLFLSQNSVNVFLYDDKPTIGISSVIDFALSAKRPIAISNSRMFRHINKPDILLGPGNTLKSIISRGLSPLDEYYKMWHPKAMVADFERIVDAVLQGKS